MKTTILEQDGNVVAQLEVYVPCLGSIVEGLLLLVQCVELPQLTPKDEGVSDFKLRLF